MGKTRLVAEARSRFLQPDEAALTGQAVDLAAGEIPLGAIGVSVRDLIQREGLDAVRRWAGPDTARSSSRTNLTSGAEQAQPPRLGLGHLVEREEVQPGHLELRVGERR